MMETAYELKASPLKVRKGYKFISTLSYYLMLYGIRKNNFKGHDPIITLVHSFEQRSHKIPYDLEIMEETKAEMLNEIYKDISVLTTSFNGSIEKVNPEIIEAIVNEYCMIKFEAEEVIFGMPSYSRLKHIHESVLFFCKSVQDRHTIEVLGEQFDEVLKEDLIQNKTLVLKLTHEKVGKFPNFQFNKGDLLLLSGLIARKLGLISKDSESAARGANKTVLKFLREQMRVAQNNLLKSGDISREEWKVYDGRKAS